MALCWGPTGPERQHSVHHLNGILRGSGSVVISTDLPVDRSEPSRDTKACWFGFSGLRQSVVHAERNGRRGFWPIGYSGMPRGRGRRTGAKTALDRVGLSEQGLQGAVALEALARKNGRLSRVYWRRMPNYWYWMMSQQHSSTLLPDNAPSPVLFASLHPREDTGDARYAAFARRLTDDAVFSTESGAIVARRARLPPLVDRFGS